MTPPYNWFLWQEILARYRYDKNKEYRGYRGYYSPAGLFSMACAGRNAGALTMLTRMLDEYEVQLVTKELLK